MDKHVEYILAELKMLAGSDQSLRRQIDSALKFCLAGWGFWSLALVAALQYLDSAQLLGGALVLAGLGMFLAGAFAFAQVLHLRFRRLEIKAQALGFRKMLLAKGYTAASYLALEEPKNNLRLADIHGVQILVLGVLSGAGAGLGLGALVWRITLSLSNAAIRDGLSLLSGLALCGVTVYRLYEVQMRYARQADKSIVECGRRAKEVIDLDRLKAGDQ